MTNPLDRLLEPIRVSRKLMLISVAFALPIGVLAFLQVWDTHKDIEVSWQELRGTEFLRPLVELNDLIPRHALAVQQVTGGETAQATAMAQVAGQIDRSFDSLEILEARLGIALRFTPNDLARRQRSHARTAAVRQKWQELRTRAGSLTIAESAKLHASLVSDVQAMISHCGDSSLLILDPDLDSYYLVDAAMLKLPQGQEHLTKTLLLGEDILRRGKVNKEDQVQFTVLGAFLQEEDIQEARASVEASLQEDSAIHGTSPTLNGAISPALRDMLTTVQTVVDITGKIAAGGEISRDAFLAAGLKAKDANLALTRTALTELEKLLHIRIASFESQRFMEAGISVAALCAALLLVWAISHSITRPLRAGTQRISDSAQVLANASQELSAVSGQVSSTAEETATQGRVVADSATQVSRNIQTVATATEEMTSSISEIARNAGEASKIAGQAVASAERTNQVMARLGTSSEEIGNVLLLISNIASQTNLLALNATIEAVRAGESGKSFAVVANEVKELARQTAKATEEISRKVAAIQADTQSGIAAIREITTTVRQINDIQMVIAGAVEEQAATTSEISSNTQQAARASSEIALNIASVADAVKNTTAGATQTAASASELSRLATDLRGVVDVFKRLDASDTAMPPARQQPAAQT